MLDGTELPEEDLRDHPDPSSKQGLAAIGVVGILAVGITGRLAARPHQAVILTTVAVLSAVPIVLLASVHAPGLVYPLVAVEGAAVVVGDVIHSSARSTPGWTAASTFRCAQPLRAAP